MIKYIGKVDRKVNLAFSGGVDSTAAAIFYKNGGRDITLYHFNHGCEYSDSIEKQCIDIANKLSIPIVVGKNTNTIKPKQSLEDFWRRSRYNFLYSAIPDGESIITTHHLNDAVETWIWSSLHGEGKIILPEQHIDFGGKNITLKRPFLLNNKTTLTDYFNNNNKLVDIVEDKYNEDMSLVRNYIRHILMPHALKVNPGIEKVIKKKYINMMY
jgi:tRNA(Ile)-lysidine synthase